MVVMNLFLEFNLLRKTPWVWVPQLSFFPFSPLLARLFTYINIEYLGVIRVEYHTLSIGVHMTINVLITRSIHSTYQYNNNIANEYALMTIGMYVCE